MRHVSVAIEPGDRLLYIVGMFMVIRVDDSGRSFIFQEGLTDDAARHLADVMSHRHKQSYYAQEYTNETKAGLLCNYGQPGGV
jgi:hypothetical protein